MNCKNFSISIVSHGHKEFVISLLSDLARLGRADFEVILTLNLPEEIGIDENKLPFFIVVIRNKFPKSFAENHNAAFVASRGAYFVVLNPDIRLTDNPFEVLLTHFQQNPTSICAPLVVNENGLVEDSARNFPTPVFLVKKFLSKTLRAPHPRDFVAEENSISMPDWIAGMFIVIPRTIFQKLRGLDEGYRMYYEDVDFCARARLAGYQIMVNGYTKVIHKAQRDSHRNLRYLAWHLRSALRFFTSKVFLKIQLTRLIRNFRWP